MKTRTIITSSLAVLGLLAMAGSGCSNNDSSKAALAALQTQMNAQGTISGLKEQLVQQQQKSQDAQACIAAGGNPASCNSILTGGVVTGGVAQPIVTTPVVPAITTITATSTH